MRFYKSEKVKGLQLIPDMLTANNGDRTVFFFQDKKQSFFEFRERSSKLGSSFQSIGIRQGDCVGLYMPNSIQYPESVFGLIKAGAIPVPLNLRMPLKTLRYIIEDSEINSIITSPLETNTSSPESAKNLAEKSGIDRLIIPGESGEGVTDYDRLIDEGDPDFNYPPRDQDDIAILIYTSGTTGKPKGVPLSHSNILSGVEAWNSELHVNAETRLMHVMPMYHVYGLNAMLMIALCNAASLVFQVSPDPELIIKNIQKYDCNQFWGVPALFRMLWLVYQQDPDRYDLSNLEEVVAGGDH